MLAVRMAIVFTVGLLPSLACRSNGTSTDAEVRVDVATPDGVVSGPDMSGWQWTQSQRAGSDFTLHELKWRRPTASADELFLYAKDYAVAEDETPASLSARDWRAYYKPVLSPIQSLDVHATTVAGRPAVAVKAEGTSPRGVASTIDEVYVPIHGHVLLTTASGPSGDVLAMARQVAIWRGRVVFATLR